MYDQIQINFTSSYSHNVMQHIERRIFVAISFVFFQEIGENRQQNKENNKNFQQYFIL